MERQKTALVPLRSLAMALLCVPLLVRGASGQTPLGTSFTYQGRLSDGGNPANGSYDLRLALFDASGAGAAVGPVLTREDVVVANGLFTVSLDFGSVFGGSKRWLELAVRPGASTGSYTTLGARQELSPAPHAVFSSGSPWAGIAGKPAGFADDVDNDSGGDITSVTPGAGLIGGGVSGAVTIDAVFGGTGAANTIARSDHDHFGHEWTGAFAGGPALRAINNATGGFTDGVWGQSAATGGGRGLVGYASASTGQNYGVWMVYTLFALPTIPVSPVTRMYSPRTCVAVATQRMVRSYDARGLTVTIASSSCRIVDDGVTRSNWAQPPQSPGSKTTLTPVIRAS